ncbi:hypothetical protein [Moorena sp. SIO1G6]|uniref:hypothetical protein n=1 Tax=Moorena sp. SIO1G6 TaxID=2607840 RepID=UPI00257DD489|nr:hypothetical protein [Moorena sp. SIO1G6]
MRYTLVFPTSDFPLPFSLLPAPCSRLDAKREWGKPRHSLMAETAFGGAASPRPRCIAAP